ncbi:MAG: hypothetical protein ACXWP5_15785, partial [Bdellovibrionota bacterium]
WIGMLSGLSISCPPLSIWVFAVLAKLGLHSPVALVHGVELVAWAGILLSLVPPLFYMPGAKYAAERQWWYWAFAIAMVNPLLLQLERKLWPTAFLPLFISISLIGWFRRERPWGALVWGFFAACLGQIEMMGFVAAFSLFAATLWSDRQRLRHTQWLYWMSGSLLGACLLIPWAAQVLSHETGAMTYIGHGWDERLGFGYQVFWISDAVGLHLGNHLGLTRGPSQLRELADFFRYPLSGGKPTYLIAIAHAGLLASGLAILGRAAYGLLLRPRGAIKFLTARATSSEILILASWIVLNVVLFVFAIQVRRYHLASVFPSQLLFLAWLARPERSRLGRALLGTVLACELVVSMGFIHYVHVNGGAPEGRYGISYRAQELASPLIER